VLLDRAANLAFRGGGSYGMNRSTRMELAKQTVEIVGCGAYTAPSGQVIDIAESVRACLDATQFFPPEALERIRQEILARPAEGLTTTFEVVNETTLSGINRVLSDARGPVAALNFASAKNPGGGFLNGSQAQEESLARSSALHASLLRAWTFYERHRASPSLLYSDAMILSPGCPIVRDDAGTLLDEPRLTTFITSAAPNAGAARSNRPEEVAHIPEVLQRRSEYVLALAAYHGSRQIVLGAWGCGVFRNDPAVVAAAFARHLLGSWSGRFERIVFSVLDRSPVEDTLAAFRRAMTQDDATAERVAD
jgi:uncharacterized protein (TIGR02452 family)